MITLTDTHTHLYVAEFDGDRDEMIKRATQLGVTRFFLPNIDEQSIDAVLKLSATYPGSCFPMMGLHPCSVTENVHEQLAVIGKQFDSHNFVGVGEIGIDLYWDKTFFEQQKLAFVEQCKWAVNKNLPVVIHCRSAMTEIIEKLNEMKQDLSFDFTTLRGIFHCFSGNDAEAKLLIDFGFYLGIGGVLTYKNSGLDKAIEHIDLKHLVLETDSPYLAPVPFRGKRNESSYLRYIAEKLAEIKQVSLLKVSTITTKNSIDIFGL